MPVRKYRRDESEINCCMKYVIFGFNVIFWLVGLTILSIGIWAWIEKDTFSNLSRLTNLALDPAFIFILVGTITVIIGFTGCVGALRENTCLLGAYAVFLGVLLLVETTVAVLGFMFKSWIKTQATDGLQAFIVHYRDDPDQQNLIDWIQGTWLHCCGIEGPQDWDRNIYFNCSSADVGSREACGVPFSCCRPKPDELIMNKQCGYDVRKPEYIGDLTGVIFERGCLGGVEDWVQRNLVPVAGVAVGVAILQPYDKVSIIFDKGCLSSSEEWLERNLLMVAGVACAIAFLQILGICFAQNLRADIFAQKAKWSEH
ncbi:unnamed protein product [Notodromas monacha]|uniref:Tetraspanin n=1 Tax=Notodromas monacha TaxID=399045 RepID=A0A7R9BUX5_9CRUS|nr:unnamed protein product [Notodromas monacha]CAG0921837.1 unnamed protein product [Notodromas monacha]